MAAWCTTVITLGIAANVQGQTDSGPAAADLQGHLHLRGSYSECFDTFSKAKKGRVAFIGGSITEMNGYRPLVERHLTKRFEDTKFDFINAGISSTCSTTGAFRLKSDVFQNGAVDLLFVEFAVNDDQDAMHARRECIRGMEGILRQARTLNPKVNIVVVYFVNPPMLEFIQAELAKPLAKRQLPVSMDAHEAVADHYDVSTVLLASEVATRIEKGDMTWEQYGGTHPKRPGNQLAADMCYSLLELAWSSPERSRRLSALPKERLDSGAYDGGLWLTPGEEHEAGAWRLTQPGWKKLPGQCRSRFLNETLLAATDVGSQTTVNFEGRAVGAYLLAGPDAGRLEASVDGGKWVTVELYHRFSKGLHYPRTVMFFTDLKPGPHRLVLRVASTHHPDSRGHAARILRFAVNQ